MIGREFSYIRSLTFQSVRHLRTESPLLHRGGQTVVTMHNGNEAGATDAATFACHVLLRHR